MTFAGFDLQPELNFKSMSADVVDYFYGVSEAEARADRPSYDPGSSFEAGVEVLVQRPIGAGFTVGGLGKLTAIGGEIRNSPLVDADYELSLALGVLYSF